MYGNVPDDDVARICTCIEDGVKEVSLPAITWEKGKRVRYTLSLTSDAAQVTFGEPEWGEWSDAEPQADPITPVK